MFRLLCCCVSSEGRKGRREEPNTLAAEVPRVMPVPNREVSMSNNSAIQRDDTKTRDESSLGSDSEDSHLAVLQMVRTMIERPIMYEIMHRLAGRTPRADFAPVLAREIKQLGNHAVTAHLSRVIAEGPTEENLHIASQLCEQLAASIVDRAERICPLVDVSVDTNSVEEGKSDKKQSEVSASMASVTEQQEVPLSAEAELTTTTNVELRVIDAQVDDAAAVEIAKSDAQVATDVEATPTSAGAAVKGANDKASTEDADCKAAIPKERDVEAFKSLENEGLGEIGEPAVQVELPTPVHCSALVASQLDGRQNAAAPILSEEEDPQVTLPTDCKFNEKAGCDSSVVPGCDKDDSYEEDAATSGSCTDSHENLIDETEKVSEHLKRGDVSTNIVAPAAEEDTVMPSINPIPVQALEPREIPQGNGPAVGGEIATVAEPVSIEQAPCDSPVFAPHVRGTL